MMLNDPRVDITFPDNEGCTPLWRASSEGRHHVVKWLIASGKDLGDLNKTGKYWDSNEYTAIEAARNAYIDNHTETISLLENLMVNPIQTGHQIRVELGLQDELAAEVFALTVFLCDDQFQLNSTSAAAPNSITTTASRFFVIASKLPMELQMVLCHRAVGSMKQNVLEKDSEAAFKALAGALLVPNSE